MMRPSLLAVVVLAMTSPAAAQSREPSIFVSVAAMADIHRHSQVQAADDTALSTPNLDTWTLASNWGAGVRHTPRWSSRVELTFSGTYSRAYRTSSPTAFQVGTASYRLRVGSVLLGYRTGSWKRVRFECLAGAGFVQQRQRRESETTVITPTSPLVPPPTVVRMDQTTTQYNGAAVVGADVSIMLSRRVALVQQLRVKTFPGLLAVSPALGLVVGF